MLSPAWATCFLVSGYNFKWQLAEYTIFNIAYGFLIMPTFGLLTIIPDSHTSGRAAKPLIFGLIGIAFRLK